MLQISAQQLAELLSGIARAQAAVVLGLETATPGTRGNYVLPAIQNVSHLRDHPNPTLIDLPVRMLLSYMGRVGPDIDAVARDFEAALADYDGALAIEPHFTTEKIGYTDAAENDICVRDRRLLPASTVRDRPRISARTVRSYLECADVVDPGDAAAARAHGADVQHRHADRQAVFQRGLAGRGHAWNGDLNGVATALEIAKA